MSLLVSFFDILSLMTKLDMLSLMLAVAVAVALQTDQTSYVEIGRALEGFQKTG